MHELSCSSFDSSKTKSLRFPTIVFSLHSKDKQMNGDKSWLELEGRVCVVSGAASGIGASLAQRLAAVGARVVLLDRDVAGLERHNATLQAQGAQTLAIGCDISRQESVQAEIGRASCRERVSSPV